MTLQDLTDKMADYNNAKEPTAECEAWQDYVDECGDLLGIEHWDQDNQDAILPETFSDYWLAVADGITDDYRADGSRRAS